MRTLSVSSRLGWTQAPFWLELRFSLDFFWTAEKNEWIKLAQRASETRRRRPRRIAVTEAALSAEALDGSQTSCRGYGRKDRSPTVICERKARLLSARKSLGGLGDSAETLESLLDL